ncbi:MAG: type II toxin-antitoxin system Phd/YefM family antitoxin [Eubacterium sp.]|nr:type II toxin-antitoxin system Phd/YefM family antitoxin [Eubacterium sp.]
MEKVKIAEFRSRLKEYVDRVADKHEEVILTNAKSGEYRNVVLISEDRYKELMDAARIVKYLNILHRNEELIKKTENIDLIKND